MVGLLDVQTLLVAVGIVFLALGGVTVFFWHENRTVPGLGLLALAHVVVLPGALLVALRGPVPLGVSVCLGNLLVVLAVSLLLQAFERLYGRTPAHWLPVSCLAAVAVGMPYFLFVKSDTAMRIVIVSVAMSALLGRAAWAARGGTRTGTERGPSRLNVAALGLLAALLASRGVAALVGVGAEFPGRSVFAVLSFTAAMACGIGWTVATLTLVSNRQRESRQRTEAALRRQGEYLASLHETALAVMRDLEVGPLLEDLVRRASSLLGALHGFIYLELPDASALECTVWVGDRPMDPLVQPGEGAVGKAWQRGEPQLVDDYDAWEGRSPQVPRGIFGSMVAMPLVWGGRTAGVIGLAHGAGSGQRFAPDDVRLLSAFGQLAAIALGNARLFAQERAARREAERLLDATRALGSTMELGEVLERILSELAEVVPYDSASVQELTGTRLEIIGGRGFADTAALKGLGFEASGDNPNARVLRSREPLILADAHREYAAFRTEPTTAAVRSWLGVPLLHGKRLVGMLTLDKKEPGFFTPDHARLAQAFAAQAAIAIENARLYAGAQQELAERKQAQEALLRSEKRYRGVVQDSLGLLCTHDLDGVLLLVNASAAATLGYATEEMVGRNLREFVPADVRPLFDEYLRTVRRDGAAEGVLRISTRGGGERLFRYRNVLRAEPGELPYVIGFALDETERVRAELALRQSEERHRSVVETAFDAFVSMDASGRITAWNPQAERTFGWSRDEAVGRLLAETIIPPAHREAHRKGLERFLASGVGPFLGKPLELPALHRDGREIPVELTISVVRAGRAHLFHAFVHDISERKRAEKLREDLTQTMVHDLRSPLTWVLGSLEALETAPDGPLTTPQQELVRGARSGAERILALVNAILDVFRLEQGGLTLDRRRLSLRPLVADVVTEVAPLAREQGLRLVQDMPADLPAVWADPQLLTRVVQNLVGNAVKFTPRDGVVRVSAVAESASVVRVTVSDSGSGVPDGVRPRLFQKFAAGPQQGRGTGLGLAFCRLAVEALGGRIWLADEPGQRGATFVFTLPAGGEGAQYTNSRMS